MPIRIGAKIDTLQALNTMAGYVGIPPLTSLIEVDTEPDFKIALDILDEVTQTTLSQGLPCNTDFDFVLTEREAITDYTIIPDGALICHVTSDNRYVERDGYVYDIQEKVNSTSTEHKAFIVWFQEFDQLPELVKRYIITAASRAFVHRIKGDAGLSQLTITDERRTKIEFQRYSFTMADYSMLDDGDLDFIAFRRRYYRSY